MEGGTGRGRAEGSKGSKGKQGAQDRTGESRIEQGIERLKICTQTKKPGGKSSAAGGNSRSHAKEAPHENSDGRQSREGKMSGNNRQPGSMPGGYSEGRGGRPGGLPQPAQNPPRAGGREKAGAGVRLSRPQQSGKPLNSRFSSVSPVTVADTADNPPTGHAGRILRREGRPPRRAPSAGTKSPQGRRTRKGRGRRSPVPASAKRKAA